MVRYSALKPKASIRLSIPVDNTVLEVGELSVLQSMAWICIQKLSERVFSTGTDIWLIPLKSSEAVLGHVSDFPVNVLN